MGYLGQPQLCLALLPFPKPVAVHAQSPFHSPNHNAGKHNTSVVVCNLYCDGSIDQQVSRGHNLRRSRQLNNHDMHICATLLDNFDINPGTIITLLDNFVINTGTIIMKHEIIKRNDK
jgi:hypothetical protein